ncbi:MAG: DUF721 domain-containing protein [Parachlamydiales bacterium]|nr:DUF721 domain-containing protein [Parachlamydiales bacterium]
MANFSRTPRNYDGLQPTGRQIKDLLPHVLKQISQTYGQRADLLFAAWPQIIGPQLAPMTKPLSYHDGVLTIMVRNSTLHSLLSQHEKPRILKNLKDKFPSTKIVNIVFRMG